MCFYMLRAKRTRGIIMKQSTICLSFVALALMLLLSGCGGISVKKMTPDIDTALITRFDKSINVITAAGARKGVFGGPAMVSNDEFTDALVATLKKANLFKEVYKNSKSDYELYSDLVAQGQGVSLNYESALVVQYRIVDPKNNEVIWKKGFNSRFTVTVLQSFSGAVRTTKAQEGSVRSNLSQLIQSLSSAKLP